MKRNRRKTNSPIFTPRRGHALGKRTPMSISKADAEAINRRGEGLHGVVTDLESGKRYEVYGCACPLENCYCDAFVVEVADGKAVTH
jgi:hypothetical protein